MNLKQHQTIVSTLKQMIVEQAPAAPTAIETDAAPSSAVDSPFTPAEEKFLGKFDAYGTQQIGIIYSISDIGIREFIARAGKELNLTPGTLLQLLRNNIIKIVPYTGWGRNDDYTIELQLSLDDVKGLGAADKEKAEAGSSASGAPAGGGGASAPAPELAWVVRYGDLLKESAKVAKQLVTEGKKPKQTVHVSNSRELKKLPKQYIKHLEQLIDVLTKKKHSVTEKQRLMADILDNLSLNLKLSDKQIQKSYEMFKKQEKLKKIIKNK